MIDSHPGSAANQRAYEQIIASGSFHVTSTNVSGMTISEFDEIYRMCSSNIHKKGCKISG